MIMEVESKLRDLILKRYKSLREFTIRYDIPYSTLNSILQPGGINKASIQNVFKICKALGISSDALAQGEIIHYIWNKDVSRVEDIIAATIARLNNYDDLTLCDVPVTGEIVQSLTDSIELSLQLVAKKIK